MPNANQLLTLIAQLAPIAASFVPGGGEASILVTTAAQLIAYIQQQSGMTTDQILDRAQVTLDQNEKDLLADLAKLQGGVPPVGN